MVQDHLPKRIVGADGDVDVEAVCAAGKDGRPARAGAAVDGNGLGYGQSAVAARIQHVDFAVNERLRDSTGEGLARGGAAARVGVTAGARHPRPRGLRMGQRGESQSESHEGQSLDSEAQLAHLYKAPFKR